MMLPLEKRSNRLLAIHIRAVSLEFTKYILQLITSEGKCYISSETECTMLPKFELDRNNKEISKFLTRTDETNVKFILCKSNNFEKNNQSDGFGEKIFEFGVDLGDLIYLCNDMSKARIKNYPIIILEFTEGYYTTKDLYINNTYNYQLEPFTNINNLSQSMNSFNHYTLGNINTAINISNSMINIGPAGAKLNKSTNLKYSTSLPNGYGLINSTLNSNKKEIKFSSLNEKFKQYEFFDKQLKVLTGDKIEKIKQLDGKLQTTNQTLEKFYKKYQMMINIYKMTNQVIHLEEKIQTYEASIESVKKLIYQKQSDLHISSSIFFLNRENYKDKIEAIEKNYKKIEKYKIMYNAFKNKKLIEVAYFFFNKMCFKFYIVPSFTYQLFDSNNKIIRYQFYQSNAKDLSVMLGNVANLIKYLSKLFNIPLKYPLYIRGSTSYIVKEKQDFIPLYTSPKFDDRYYLKIDLAMNYLQENLNEVLKYFLILDQNSTNTPKNLFSDFLKLHSFLINVVNKNLVGDDS